MLVDGKKIQSEIEQELKELVSKRLRVPSLGIVLVGEDPASEKFVSLKQKFGESVGVDVWIKILSETATTERVLTAVNELETEGVVVQLPLPKQVDQQAVLTGIPKEKDVDVLNGGDFTPPVAGAVFEVLDRNDISLENKKIVVVGEGRLVGVPVIEGLNKRNLQHDVVSLDTDEEEKLKLLKHADVIITGAGDPHFIKPDMIKEGVVLVDAGTSESAGVLVGDVDPACQGKVSLMTPVPGGIGPITVAVLFRNLITKCLN
jgi:methylenetetrahydrofolate dehydrogenase (NADP+)/methenyltetrahydrofolate cyclohydrolase